MRQNRNKRDDTLVHFVRLKKSPNDSHQLIDHLFFYCSFHRSCYFHWTKDKINHPSPSPSSKKRGKNPRKGPLDISKSTFQQVEVMKHINDENAVRKLGEEKHPSYEIVLDSSAIYVDFSGMFVQTNWCGQINLSACERYSPVKPEMFILVLDA